MKNKLLALTTIFLFTACGALEKNNASSEIAADTSGCSQLLRTSVSVKTVQGFTLQVASVMPNSPRCWNANLSRVSVTYRWTQETMFPREKTVGFWIRADGVEQFNTSWVECSEYTTGQYHCHAHTELYKHTSQLEVAPVRDDVWDTAGIGQNYFFRLQ